MLRSNIKLLTADESYSFNTNYKIILKEDLVIVQYTKRNISVTHPIDSDFNIYNKEVKRKITIKKEAIEIWKNNFIDSKFSLIDVQNAMNALVIGYQTLSVDDIKNQLKIINDNYAKLV